MDLNHKKKVFSKFALVSSLLFCSYFYLTPYLSILSFKSAIEKKDYKGARKFINFDSVRKSLKSQLLPALEYRSERKISDSAFSDIKMMLLKPILKVVVDRTVDSTVNPYGLELLLKTGQLTQRVVTDEEISNEQRIDKKEPRVRLYYKNLNVFVLSSETADENGTVNSYWQRGPFFEWRLHAIELPPRTILSVSR